jgi:valyl-tRNA synthetase
MVHIVTSRPEAFNESTFPFFARLASASGVEVTAAFEGENAVQIVTDAATAYIPMGELVDFEAERARLEKELKAVCGEISRVEGKLSNAGFVAKAPAAVVDGEREKLARYTEKKRAVEEAIAALK